MSNKNAAALREKVHGANTNNDRIRDREETTETNKQIKNLMNTWMNEQNVSEIHHLYLSFTI